METDFTFIITFGYEYPSNSKTIEATINIVEKKLTLLCDICGCSFSSTETRVRSKELSEFSDPYFRMIYTIKVQSCDSHEFLAIHHLIKGFELYYGELFSEHQLIFMDDSESIC